MKEDSIKFRWLFDYDKEIILYISYLVYWSKSYFFDKRDYYSILFELFRKIIFYIIFDIGFLGLFGVMIRDNWFCVVVMVRGGILSCFYENCYLYLLVEDNYKVEYGYVMFDIYYKMLKFIN